MIDYMGVTEQNAKKRVIFFKKLRQYIYEESLQRLWYGSCAITMKAVIQRLNKDKDLDFNIILDWPHGWDVSNIDKHIQFLDRLATRKDSGVFKIVPAGKISIHMEAQRVANSGALVVILNANYYYSDRQKKRGGQHHAGIVIDDFPATDNPMMGQGGIRRKEHIFGRAYTWMQWFKKNDRGIYNKDTTVYFWLK